MRAVVFETPGELSITDIPEPVAARGEVVLRVDAAGLCGTDIHTFHGQYPSPFPYVPGHEFAGTVLATGEGVDPSLIGREFAVHPLESCLHCPECRAGRINFCANFTAYGSHRPGGFAERIAVRVDCLHPLPEGVSPQEGAFAEPLACVLHGLDRVGVEAGDRVLLYGAGSIGLLLLQATRAMGASRVDVVDLLPNKLEMAAGLGGTPLPLGAEAEREAYDLVIDATGVVPVVSKMVANARNGGRVLYFGVCPPGARIEIEPFEIFRREISIVGCFSLGYEIDRSLRMIAGGAVQVKPLISARRPLEEMRAAIAEHDAGGSAIKTLFLPNG